MSSSSDVLCFKEKGKFVFYFDQTLNLADLALLLPRCMKSIKSAIYNYNWVLCGNVAIHWLNAVVTVLILY